MPAPSVRPAPPCVLHELTPAPGTLVMCDGDHVEKLLSQFLVTDELRLVLSDADAMPAVDYLTRRVAKCGHRQFADSNAFIAPEAKWPFAGQRFESAIPRLSRSSSHVQGCAHAGVRREGRHLARAGRAGGAHRRSACAALPPRRCRHVPQSCRPWPGTTRSCRSSTTPSATRFRPVSMHAAPMIAAAFHPGPVPAAGAAQPPHRRAHCTHLGRNVWRAADALRACARRPGL